MKLVTKYAITAMTLAATAISALAQDASSSSSSTVVRRRGDSRTRGEQAATPGVTDRMKQFYESAQGSDADRMWMRVIYRDLKLDNPKTQPSTIRRKSLTGRKTCSA